MNLLHYSFQSQFSQISHLCVMTSSVLELCASPVSVLCLSDQPSQSCVKSASYSGQWLVMQSQSLIVLKDWRDLYTVKCRITFIWFWKPLTLCRDEPWALTWPPSIRAGSQWHVSPWVRRSSCLTVASMGTAGCLSLLSNCQAQSNTSCSERVTPLINILVTDIV